jgi:apolipoprotein N-acyltransferase
MALGIFTPGRPVMENRLVTVDPAGRVVGSYDKATRVPGDRQADGHRAIPVLDTPHGRLAALCFDMDFPRLVRRRSGSRADVVIVPAKDWRAIREMHATMAVCRGIENGMSVVRQTYQGVSMASDYQGRILAWVDDYESPRPALTAYVPARGTATVYSAVGDALGWISVGVTAASCLRARRSRPRS